MNLWTCTAQDSAAAGDAQLTPTRFTVGSGKSRRLDVIRALLALALCLFAAATFAVDPMPFRDAAEEARFRALAAELRCVMCQNQSLADSNAPIARDLRNEVLELMQQGRSDEEIKAFLTERYTDFVLYRPPLRGSTLWLWIIPPVLLAGGALVLFVVVRRRAHAAGNGTVGAPQPDDGEDW